MSCLIIGLLHLATMGQIATNVAEIRQLSRTAKPGTIISIAPGEYRGGLWIQDLHGSEGMPITVCAADPKNPPRFVGGSGVHFSKVSHLVITDLMISDVSANGLNVDDGGNHSARSHHIRIENVTVTNTPKGNNDGIKLSGLQNFQVVNCTVSNWGGSAIDMVGCHDGLIKGGFFKDGGDSGVQMKGGTSRVTVQDCRFNNYGMRGVNLGGSTGVEFFRPPLSTIAHGAKSEARDLRVEGCTFVGGTAALAFVGVDGAVVRRNTIVNPERWAIRILQETRLPGFIPCRKGVFEENTIVFFSSRWVSGGVNVGEGTEPASFRFARNRWFCSDMPAKSKPNLPTVEVGGVYGVDPKIKIEIE